MVGDAVVLGAGAAGLGAARSLARRSLALPAAPQGALYGLAAGILLPIFIGIRNAWDVVTYLVVGTIDESSK